MKMDEKLEIKTITKECKLDKTNLLEIGCGDGRISFRLANFVKKITAIDPSEKDINKAKDKLVSLGAKNISFFVGKGENLDFEDNFFDRIFYSLSFHHITIEKQIDAVKEAYRTLNKDGYLILYEPLEEGEMQKLFLLFEDELNEMNNVYRIIEQKEVKKLFNVIKQKKFRITWKFDDIGRLIDYFTKLYSKENVQANINNIKNILKKKLNDKSLIIDDDLTLIMMKVNK